MAQRVKIARSNSNRTMGLAVLFGVVVLVSSLAVAYVLFGILESSASGQLQQWKLEGGIAGFAFTALLLSSIIFQFYKEVNRDKAEDYLKEIQELQTKLIRGAPQPPAYTIDIDERHKLVFARPEAWKPKGGLLYQYVSPAASGDDLPANFNVVFETPDDLSRYGVTLNQLREKRSDPGDELEVLYQKVIEGLVAFSLQFFPGYEREGFSQEYVMVDGLKGVRYTHTYSAIRVQEAEAEDENDIVLDEPPPVNDGGAPRPEEGAHGAMEAGQPAAIEDHGALALDERVADGDPSMASPAGQERIRLTQVGLLVYHPRLSGMFTFTFTDDSDDFLRASEDFNQIVSSIRFLW